MKNIVEKFNLNIVNIEVVDYHGGSLRVCVQKIHPNYGLLELGDSRVRSLKTLNKLIKKVFFDYKIKITHHILTFSEKPKVLAREVSGFFYASLVLSSKHYDALVSELTDYFNKVSVNGLSEFNLPVNRLVVKKT